MFTGIYKDMCFKQPYYLSPQDKYNDYLRKHSDKQDKGLLNGRDSERLKTYRAEWALSETYGYGIKFKSIEEVQKYVNKVTKSKTYTALWLEAYELRKGKDIGAILRGTNVQVSSKVARNGEGNAGFAYIEENRIVLDTHTGMNEYTVLHELAHCVGYRHHGRSFRKTIMKLTSRFMGKEAADALKFEFKQRKLSFGEARKPMTFEKWTASKQRMENIREQGGNL